MCQSGVRLPVALQRACLSAPTWGYLHALHAAPHAAAVLYDLHALHAAAVLYDLHALHAAPHAAAVLYDPPSGKIAGLEPCHFITLATPHAGCDSEAGPSQASELSLLVGF